MIGGYALTSHKAQSHTYSKAIVDLSTIDSNAAVYVTMSRLKTLAGLAIMGDFPYKNLTVPIPPELVRVNKRVREMDITNHIPSPSTAPAHLPHTDRPLPFTSSPTLPPTQSSLQVVSSSLSNLVPSRQILPYNPTTNYPSYHRLPNLGNRCYANATFQALAVLPEFTSPLSGLLFPPPPR